MNCDLFGFPYPGASSGKVGTEFKSLLLIVITLYVLFHAELAYKSDKSFPVKVW